MSRHKPTAASEIGHNPRYQYDCERCKYHWCCGPTCQCMLRDYNGVLLREPPRKRQDEVDAALVKVGLCPQYRGKGAQRR